MAKLKVLHLSIIFWKVSIMLCWATSNTQERGQLGIAMNGFWGGGSERSFVDVCVFNPLAPSYNSSTLSAIFKKYESIKGQAYSQQIHEVGHASFAPIVMSARTTE